MAVVRPGFLEAVEEVCARWELHCTPIGEVTDTGELRAFHAGETLGEIPAHLLTDEAPRYRVEPRPRTPLAPAPDPPPALPELLASPNIRSRAWIYERYDHLVGSRTVRRPGLDAAVLRLRPSMRGLAVSLDGPAPDAARSPRLAGALAVLEAARNVACAGGEAAGPDRLPQLRQPGEAGDRLGARRGDRGDGARGGGARRARRLRKRLALQRDRRARDPADAGRRLRRARAGRARRPGPVAGGRRRVVVAGSRTTRRAPARPRRRGARWSSSSGARRRCSRSRTTSPTAASRSRSPRRRSGAGSAPTSSCPRPGPP